jgi:hypothetical protein
MTTMPSRFAAGIAGSAVLRGAFVLLSLLATVGDAVAQQPAKPMTPATNSPPPVKPSTAENTKCIGVVSAIGDTFSLQKIGIYRLRQ